MRGKGGAGFVFVFVSVLGSISSLLTSSATAAAEDNAGEDALTPNERLGVRNSFFAPLNLVAAAHDDVPLLA
jgi:hypothetical protein